MDPHRSILVYLRQHGGRQFVPATRTCNGDLNFDGVLDAVDYGTIDNGIQLQGPPL